MNINLFYIKINKMFILVLILVFAIVLTLCICFDTISYKEIKPDGSVKEFILNKQFINPLYPFNKY